MRSVLPGQILLSLIEDYEDVLKRLPEASEKSGFLVEDEPIKITNSTINEKVGNKALEEFGLSRLAPGGVVLLQRFLTREVVARGTARAGGIAARANFPGQDVFSVGIGNKLNQVVMKAALKTITEKVPKKIAVGGIKTVGSAKAASAVAMMTGAAPVLAGIIFPLAARPARQSLPPLLLPSTVNWLAVIE